MTRDIHIYFQFEDRESYKDEDDNAAGTVVKVYTLKQKAEAAADEYRTLVTSPFFIQYLTNIYPHWYKGLRHPDFLLFHSHTFQHVKCFV
jgi:hypothetical protein